MPSNLFTDHATDLTSIFTPIRRAKSRCLSAPTATNPAGQKLTLEFPVLEKDILACGVAEGDNCPRWEITPEVLASLAANTNRFIAAGHRSAWVNGHFGDRKRLGDVFAFRVQGDQMFAKFKLTDRNEISLGRFGEVGDETWDEVSVEIDEIDLGDGGEPQMVILAVATVTTPVITNQGPFKRVLSKPNSSRTGKFRQKLAAKASQQPQRPQINKPQQQAKPQLKQQPIKLSAKGAKFMADEEMGDGVSSTGATYTTKPNASYVEIADLKQWMPDIPAKVTTFAQLEIYMEVKMGQASPTPSAQDIIDAPIEDATGEGEGMAMSRLKPAVARLSQVEDPRVAELQAQIAEFEADKRQAFKLSLKELVTENRITPAQAESLEHAGKAAKWSLSILSPFKVIPSTGGQSATGVKTERRALSKFGEGMSDDQRMSDDELRRKHGLPVRANAK